MPLSERHKKMIGSKGPTTLSYEIRWDGGKWQLWSVVTGSFFGGRADNFVCEGTEDYCLFIMAQLEKELRQ